MLRRLVLRDFVIVPALELEFDAGFSVLTGETGAGKSILVDALQLALGARGDAGVVREGAARAEVACEFDPPAALARWLDDGGFAGADALLLRRTIDRQGRSRAWINGSAATIAQLREASEHLVEIHGQHAWQTLTRAASARELLDRQAGIDTAALADRFAQRKAAAHALEQAQQRGGERSRERDRLAWQIGELDRLAPVEGEWDTLSAEHDRLAHAQALIEAARAALDALADGDPAAETLAARAAAALAGVAVHDRRLAAMIDVLDGALAQLHDAVHSLNAYLAAAEVEPQRLAEVDSRLAAWLALARRFHRPAAELPALREQWRSELDALDAAADLSALEAAAAQADRAYFDEAARVARARKAAAPALADGVTRAMQGLGMAGGRFEIAFEPLAQPQAAGVEAVEFLVAAHAGSAPRPLAKVASGGELSRLALAVIVSSLHDDALAPTLIFDEIDAGIGGAVGDTVGALLARIGRRRQVLAVTHLAQVAACAQQHFVVAKTTREGSTLSAVAAVSGAARAAEVARMLGGERNVQTRLAHAQAMLHDAGQRERRAADPAEQRA